ncbi:ferredoxin [Halohasta salina]|uniref:ferredoxin n=1 Tax=Halohasta salina TaxID=2961621 RepID=UPI0020A4DE2B|nr:ferredoxin [Halohasta salina]
MTTYEVTLNKDPCDGIFACLTRDPRFVEADDGLATIDPDADPIYDGGGEVHEEDGRVVATFDDDRIEEAKQAAAACPTNAIVVEEVEE